MKSKHVHTDLANQEDKQGQIYYKYVIYNKKVVELQLNERQCDQLYSGILKSFQLQLCLFTTMKTALAGEYFAIFLLLSAVNFVCAQMKSSLTG